MNYLLLFLFFIININFSLCFINPPNKLIYHPNNLLNTKNNMMIDPTIMPDFTKALIINGLGYNTLKYSNQKSLTQSGLIHSTFLGIGLMTFLGIKGYLLCVIYFILGSGVTKIKMEQKKKEGIAEKNNGARGPENVWGSASVAMICAILSYIDKSRANLYKLAYVSSLATKLADTFQSEIGKAFGKNTFLITNLKKVPRGTEGAISIEGTIAGILGSLLINIAAYKLKILDQNKEISVSIVSSQIATFIESYIGAKYQKKWLNNEIVNAINTLIGAILSKFFYDFL